MSFQAIAIGQQQLVAQYRLDIPRKTEKMHSIDNVMNLRALYESFTRGFDCAVFCGHFAGRWFSADSLARQRNGRLCLGSVA
ncbi:hypothetical protein [Methylomonas koyamae]|uniref:hypothetical protein n=1 Tax=Methylomonas koyamae TaxID=702114 RepID=UPI0012F624A2|nr:hypothetical protein [Methylomonas koyamae]